MAESSNDALNSYFAARPVVKKAKAAQPTPVAPAAVTAPPKPAASEQHGDRLVNLSEAKEEKAAAAAAAAQPAASSWGAAPSQHGKPAVSASQFPTLGQEKKPEQAAPKKKAATTPANSNPYAALNKKK